MTRRIIFSLIIVLFTSSTILSQTYIFQVQQLGEKFWAYAGLDGNLIIEPKYKVSTMFTEQGYALVVYKNVYAIINIQGSLINCEVNKVRPYINPWSGAPSSFSDGYLVVTENERWGCINYEGKLKIPFKYDRITDFYGGYALAGRDKEFFVLDKEGNEFKVDVAKIKEIKHFSEGMGVIEVKGGNWGFVDSTGKIAIEPQYDGVGYFTAGLAWARLQNGKIGFLNKMGEWVIKPQFDAAKSFDIESGLAMVKLGYQWGYIDTDGNFNIFNETEKTYVFSEGLAIGKKGNKIGFIDKTGQWAIEPKFKGARPFKNGYAAVEIKNLWGIIDKNGKMVVQPKYTHIREVAIVK